MSWFSKMKLKKILPNSLYSRFLLIIVIPVLVVQFVSIYVFFYSHIDIVSKNMARNVVAQILFVKRSINNLQYQEFLTNFSENVGLKFELKKNIKISRKKTIENNLNKNYKYIREIIDPYNRFKLELRQNNLEPDRIYESEIDDDFLTLEIPDGKDVIVFQIRKKNLTSSSAYVFTLWMLFTSIITLLISIVFLKNQIRSIRQLSQAAEKIGKGFDSTIIRAYGPKEIRSLALSFIKMQERVMRQISQRTDMLSGVSHDLRTPLTRMKLQLELMEQSQEIDDLKSDISDMEKLVEEYLSFARNDDKEISKPVEIKKFIHEKIIRYYAKMDKKIESFIKIDDDFKISLKKLAFKRALVNLIDNAFNYGQKVELNIFASNSNLIIAIDDNGPGIPEEERNKVLTPFYRIDNSRNLDSKSLSGGSGLGLAIANDAIISHGGHIRLSDSHLGGLRITIFLPK